MQRAIWIEREKKDKLSLRGGVKVSTGAVKSGKRAAVSPVCVKKDPLKRNDKTNNNFAFAA